MSLYLGFRLKNCANRFVAIGRIARLQVFGRDAKYPTFKQYHIELGGDGVIWLTDGLLGDSIEEPAFPTIWGIISGYKAPYEWGTAVEIK